MLTFTVSKPRLILEQQWTFLLNRVQLRRQNTFIKYFIGLLAATGLYLLFYFMTSVNAFIILKGIAMYMIALAWCVIAVLYIVNMLGKERKRKQLQQFLESVTDAQLNYTVEIDDDNVAILLKDKMKKFPWAEFSAFGINKETIYVLNKEQGVNSLYWDKSEIGSEAYNGLKEIIEKKAMWRAF